MEPSREVFCSLEFVSQQSVGGREKGKGVT